MRRCVLTTLCTLAGLLLLAPAASAQLAPYWLPAPACSLTVLPPGGNVSDQRVLSTRLPLIQRSTGSQPEWEETVFVLDGDGDLCANEVSTYDPPMSLDVLSITYDPPLKVLDYPLTTGKSWTSTTTTYSSTGGLPRTLERTGTVIGPRTVDTVLGSLPVIEVEFTTTYFGITSSVTCLLHEQLGDVSGLVAVSGCEAVPNGDTSWSSLKADYR